MFSLSKKRKLTDVEKIETPMSWFLTGQLISLGALGYLAHTSFNVPYWMSCIAVVISFFLALVVCRITGEANITPTGAMGKVTQLIFGGIAPGHVTANLMAANITSGASSSSADLLVDLKVGYLLGANPRKQFIAQFSGNFSGNPRLRAGLPLHGSGCERSPGFQCSGSQNMGGHSGSTGHGVQPFAQHQGAFHHCRRYSRTHSGAYSPLYSPDRKMAPPPPSASAWPGPSSGTTPSFFFTGAVLGWAADHLFKAKSREYKVPTASGIIAGAALTGMAILMFSIYQAAL